MNIYQLSEQLAKATSLKEAELALKAYLSHFGFTHYAFTYYTSHTKSGQKVRYSCVSNALEPWHNYYLEQAYADVDRTLEKSHAMTLPLYWDLQQQLANAKNKREQRIRLESVEFGLDRGLCVPAHGPNDDFCVLVLHQCQHEKCLENYEVLQFEWLSASHVFYCYINKLLTLNTPATITYKLTKREKQCLALTAKSWRVEDIAKELKITPRTVNFHLQNSNKKLGTNNKYLAIYKYLELCPR